MAAHKSIAERLHQARNAHQAAIVRLQEIERDRAEVLKGDIDAIANNTAELGKQRHLVSDLADQISALEAEVDLEEAAARSRQYAAQVEKVEQLLPARVAAARALEKAIGEVITAARQFVRATEQITAAYPRQAARFDAHHLRLGRAGELIERAFVPGAPLQNPITNRSPGGREYLDHLLESRTPERFADGEVKHHAELLEALRQWRLPDENSAPAPHLAASKDAAA